MAMFASEAPTSQDCGFEVRLFSRVLAHGIACMICERERVRARACDMHHALIPQALAGAKALAAEAETASAVVDSGAVQADGCQVPRQVRRFSRWGIEI